MSNPLDSKTDKENIELLESQLKELESHRKILCDELQKLLWCDGLNKTTHIDEIASHLNEKLLINKSISDINKLITQKRENLNKLLSPVVEDYISTAKEAKVSERNRFKSAVKPNVAYQNAMRRREWKTYIPESSQQSRSLFFFLFFWWEN
jgi:hypothetical protein